MMGLADTERRKEAIWGEGGGGGGCDWANYLKLPFRSLMCAFYNQLWCGLQVKKKIKGMWPKNYLYIFF